MKSNLDVDGIAVAKLPSGECIAFSKVDASRPYPNTRKVELEGDALTAAEFCAWLETGCNHFDVAPHPAPRR